jgi:hypothetical protein
MVHFLDRVELIIVALASKLAPWAASALAVSVVIGAGLEYLNWSPLIAVIAAVALECSGVLAIYTFLRLNDYNVTRRDDDPPAPKGAAIVSLVIYFGSLFAIVITSHYEPLRGYMMLVSPLISLGDLIALGLSSSQTRREALVAERAAEREAEKERVRAERKAAREAAKADSESVQGVQPSVRAEHKAYAAGVKGVRAGVRADVQGVQGGQNADNKRAIANWLDTNPGAPLSACADELNISRTTVYKWAHIIEQARTADGVRGVQGEHADEQSA